MLGYISGVLAAGGEWYDFINYEIVRGNSVWRFGLVLVCIIAAMAIGRIVQFFVNKFAGRRELAEGQGPFTLFLHALSKPIYVGIFAIGLNLCKVFLYFDDEDGIREVVYGGWGKVAHVVASIAIAYAVYRLVDVLEYYLERIVSKTDTKLDDMLVPVVRKSIRITIGIFIVLYMVESVVGREKVTSLLLGAGVGGIAIALAAKDTVANFFGSITIFADRPFQVDELVKINGHYGSIEEVGFRSTRIRTLNGSLVTIPNNTVANSDIENVGMRPFIRRDANITITYDSGSEKTQKAVDIIKKILSEVSEINSDAEKRPRVFFSDFNDWSLNIAMSYWVKPAKYKLFLEVNERVNFAIMKRFEAEGIEFAFPSQTLYLKNDDNRN